MIKTTPARAAAPAGRPVINAIRGEFQTPIAGRLFRFDTRLSTVAAIEDACGDRAIVDVLNGIITGRRARDQIPLIGAALAAAVPEPDEPAALAAQASAGEAEAFILALVFALGFSIAAPAAAEDRQASPLAEPSAGDAGGSSRSAA